MPVLLLLNGPPASGKSTIASRLAAVRPSAMNLDIDLLRAEIDGWRRDPIAAGLAARKQAIEIARAHLLAGDDVVVPQFLAKVDFIEELEVLTAEVGATFVEVMLQLDRKAAIRSFEQRSRRPSDQSHRDAAFLVEQSSSPDPIGDMYDAAQQMMALRPNMVPVAVIQGDINATVDAVRAVID